MRDGGDIIRCVLQMVMDAHPSFSEAQAMQIEQHVRHEWGGEQVKIAKRAPVLREARERVRAEIGLKSLDALHGELNACGTGVSRRTLYRWIGKNK